MAERRRDAGDGQGTGRDAGWTGVPGTEAPGTEAPGTEAPGTEAPGTDVPGRDAPRGDAPRGDAPRGDAPRGDAPRGDAPRAGEALARAWRDLVAAARRTVADGLVVGTSGNVSVRVGDTVLVTPTGVPYDRLTDGDLCGVSLDGRQVLGSLVPTSELPMHLAVHRSTGAHAVVHTHAVHATAVSTLVEELPLVHYMAAALGGPVRVAPYATYGTEELARNVLEALRDRTACLLRNHGTLAYGATLDQAYDRTAQLEWMCRVWLTASSVPGRTPALLTGDQVARAGERMKGYGQP